jgi:hypothetical protein
MLWHKELMESLAIQLLHGYEVCRLSNKSSSIATVHVQSKHSGLTASRVPKKGGIAAGLRLPLNLDVYRRPSIL